MEYDLNVNVFKLNGSFYTNSIVKTQQTTMFHIETEILDKIIENKFELVSGTKWIIHVEPVDVPNGYPILILHETIEEHVRQSKL